MSTKGLSWTVYTWRGSCQWRSEKWVEQPMHWQVIHAKPKGNRNLSVTLIEVPMSDAILPHSPGKREDLHKPVGLWPCHNQGGNQYWMLSKQGEIRQVCITLIGWRSRALLPLPSGGTRHAWTLLELTWFSTLATEARAISIGSTGDQRNHLKILILNSLLSAMLTPHFDMVQAEGAWLFPRTRKSFRWRSAVRTTQGNKMINSLFDEQIYQIALIFCYFYANPLMTPFAGNGGASKIMTPLRRSIDRTLSFPKCHGASYHCLVTQSMWPTYCFYLHFAFFLKPYTSLHFLMSSPVFNLVFG